MVGGNGKDENMRVCKETGYNPAPLREKSKGLSARAGTAAAFLITPGGQCVLIAVFLLFHLPFVGWNLCGDPDHARFIMDAVNWKITGSPDDLAYRSITSPLYVLLLFGAMQWLSLGVYGLIIFSTVCSLAAHCAVIPLFISVCKLLGLRPAATLIALLILQLMPNMWFSSLSGFASIVSMSFFMGAILCYSLYLKGPLSVARIGWLALTILLYGLSAAIKLDMAICGAAFFAMVLIFAPRTRRWVELISLSMIAAGGYLVNHSIGLVFDQVGADTGSRILFWNGFFGANTENLLHHYTVNGLLLSLRAYGVWIIPASLLFIAHLLLAFRQTKQGLGAKLFFCVMWSFPLFLFKHSMVECTAREVLFVSPGIALLFGLYYEYFPSRRTITLFAITWLAGVLMVPPSSQLLFPSARLMKSSRMFKQHQENIRSLGETVGRMPGPKILVVGTEIIPYIQVYSLARHLHSTRKVRLPYAFAAYTIHDSAETKTIAFHWGKNPDITMLRTALQQGFVLYVYDGNIRQGLVESGLPFVDLYAALSQRSAR